MRTARRAVVSPPTGRVTVSRRRDLHLSMAGVGTRQMGIIMGLCVRRASVVVSMGGVAPRRIIVAPAASQRLGLVRRVNKGFGGMG